MPKVIKSCQTCGCEFESYEANNRKFCSIKCKNTRINISIKCINCGDEFIVTESSYKARTKTGVAIKYCSIACRSIGMT